MTLRTSELTNELMTALAKAQGDIKGAKKDAENPHFRAKYADLASVREACNEALTKNGISYVQAPYSEGELIGVTTRLSHASGQWVESNFAVKPLKNDAQGAGAVVTYLRRFALAAMVGVAPEDDDGEAAVGRGQYPQRRPAPAPPPRPQPKPEAQKKPPPETDGGQEIPFDEDGVVQPDPAVAWLPPAEVSAALESRNLGPWLRWFLSVIKDLDQEAGIKFADIYISEIKLVKNSGGRNWAALTTALAKVSYFVGN